MQTFSLFRWKNKVTDHVSENTITDLFSRFPCSQNGGSIHEEDFFNQETAPVPQGYFKLPFKVISLTLIVTSSNVLRKGSLQTKLNAGLSEQQQEDLFQNERSFHEVKLLTARTRQTYTASANLNKHSFCHT